MGLSESLRPRTSSSVSFSSAMRPVTGSQQFDVEAGDEIQLMDGEYAPQRPCISRCPLTVTNVVTIIVVVLNIIAVVVIFNFDKIARAFPQTETEDYFEVALLTDGVSSPDNLIPIAVM